MKKDKENEDLVKIHLVLKDQLLKKGISIRELSRRTELPVSTLSSWAKKGSKPSDLNALKKVANELKVSVDELVYGTSPAAVNLDTLPSDILLEGVFRIRLEKIKEGK